MIIDHSNSLTACRPALIGRWLLKNVLLGDVFADLIGAHVQRRVILLGWIHVLAWYDVL